MRVSENSNWDLNWLEAWGPCLAVWFACLLFLSLQGPLESAYLGMSD